MVPVPIATVSGDKAAKRAHLPVAAVDLAIVTAAPHFWRNSRVMTKHANAMWPKTLALANAALLAVHQIDSAFWHEWDMFGLPGGNQLNLILNIPLVGLVIHAYGRVASDAGAARRWQILIAALGFLTVGIHTAFSRRAAQNLPSRCRSLFS